MEKSMKKINTKGLKADFNVRRLVKIALLSALAVVLMFFEIPIPIFPEFLKIDLSDLPALLGGFALGPVSVLAIELIKNIFHFFLKNDGTGGVGNLANFIVGVSLAIPASLIYLKKKDKIGAIIGMIVGIVAMVVIAIFANYYLIIPAYEKIMPLENIIAYMAKANSAIVDVKTYVLFAVIPFNFLKAVVVSIITALLYKKVSPILHK